MIERRRSWRRANHSLTRSTSAPAQAVGVRQRRYATRSATVVSISCPMPVRMGIGEVRDRTGDGLRVERGQVGAGAAAPDDAHRVDPDREQPVEGAEHATPRLRGPAPARRRGRPSSRSRWPRASARSRARRRCCRSSPSRSSTERAPAPARTVVPTSPRLAIDAAAAHAPRPTGRACRRCRWTACAGRRCPRFAYHDTRTRMRTSVPSVMRTAPPDRFSTALTT